MTADRQGPAANIDLVDDEHAREVDRAFEIKAPLQNLRIASRLIPVIVAFLIAAAVVVVLFALPR
jgi:hypothetical protein